MNDKNLLKLLLNLVKWLPDKCIQRLIIATNLYLRDPRNLFEYFLKSQFEKVTIGNRDMDEIRFWISIKFRIPKVIKFLNLKMSNY